MSYLFLKEGGLKPYKLHHLHSRAFRLERFVSTCFFNEKKTQIHFLQVFVFYRVKNTNSKTSTTGRAFYSAALKAAHRIGPHQQDVIEGLIGNLLGDGFAEKRGGSTRIVLKQSAKKVQYITFLHQLMCKGGVCNPKTPRLSKVVGESGRQYFSARFATYTFSSLNFIHEAFYVQNGEGRFVKRVPPSIGDMLTERGLAHWIMDDGSPYKSGKKMGGLRLSTESFSFEDVPILQRALLHNFSLESSLHRHKMPSGGHKPLIYIPKNQRPRLKGLCEKYFVDAMMYKLEY